jgi:putative glutamine amidotransferase
MIVLVTAGNRVGVDTTQPNSEGRVRPKRSEVWVAESYLTAIRAAGGTPLIVVPEEENIDQLMDLCQAVVITGGHFDIHPSHYGAAQTGRIDNVDPARTGTELALARACIERDIPVLGVCGGMQALAVAAGGTLVQDITTGLPGTIEHEQPTDPATPWHEVTFSKGRLYDLFGSGVRVNSTHHQSVEHPGTFTVTGVAPDGVIEAIERPDLRFCVGVQWHPELLCQPIYEALILSC